MRPWIAEGIVIGGAAVFVIALASVCGFLGAQFYVALAGM